MLQPNASGDAPVACSQWGSARPRMNLRWAVTVDRVEEDQDRDRIGALQCARGGSLALEPASCWSLRFPFPDAEHRNCFVQYRSRLFVRSS
jgi:hypothetical protein